MEANGTYWVLFHIGPGLKKHVWYIWALGVKTSIIAFMYQENLFSLFPLVLVDISSTIQDDNSFLSYFVDISKF